MSNTVNPWEMQRALMQMSDQVQPHYAVLSKNSIMYAALILEEAAELIREGMLPAIQRTQNDMDLLPTIHRLLDVTSDQMLVTSLDVRRMLETLPDFAVALTASEAIGALDGTTDLTVVNCGYALASGLPGAEAYAEVTASNLSKCNPDTGKIDKTPDGKWIKGRNFAKPDLDSLLERRIVE